MSTQRFLSRALPTCFVGLVFLGFVFVGFVFVGFVFVGRGAAADSESSLQELDRATRKLTDHTYQLQHKFTAGEKLEYEVVHLVTVETRVQGVDQQNRSRSKSTKVWRITEADAGGGEATFAHSVEHVNMWSETTGQEPVRYDSSEDAEPPATYRQVAEMVGQPISIVTVNAQGEVTKRQDEFPQIDMGTGGLTVPLPAKPVRLGDEWAIPNQVRVRLSDGRFQSIKTRQRYRLEKVETGVATISLQTQVLTPVDDGRVRSQLIQKMSQGEIKFDIDAGRMLSKQLDWNEEVVGFNGPESNMSYLARMTERLVGSEPKTARAE